MDEARRKGVKTMTPRRLEVLYWVAMGKSNQDIAQILSISQLTVKNHLADILVLLNATNRAYAVAKAVQRGLISVE